MERLKARLEKLFGMIQFEVRDKLSYLGMDVYIKNHGMMIDMQFYVQQLLEGERLEEFDSPGMKDLFIVMSESKVLQEDVRKSFHSKTEKMLYLAKCAHPDILMAVTFLCTRVQGVTTEDRDKLQHVLRFEMSAGIDANITRSRRKKNYRVCGCSLCCL